MTDEQKIADYMAKHPKSGYRDAGRICGTPDSVTRTLVREWKAKHNVTANGTAELSLVGLQGLDAVVSAFDIVGRALKMVRSIPSGKYKRDEDLQRDLGIGNERWRRARGSQRLSGCWFQLPDKSILWGSTTSIAALSARIKEL